MLEEEKIYAKVNLSIHSISIVFLLYLWSAASYQFLLSRALLCGADGARGGLSIDCTL